jgi:Calcineurin-like phosphoesterase
MRVPCSRMVLASLSFVCLVAPRASTAQTAPLERVQAIKAPTNPLPDEGASRGITKFSFIAYGDTRGRRDGLTIQYEHSLLVDSMLAQIKKLASTEYPVKFVLQSGDAVQDGREVKQWNVSFVPLINRLTTEGGVPYFLVPGNHEGTTSDAGMKNYLDAVSALIPPEGSPHRLKDRTTFSFAYGNTFVVGLDANIAGDESQYQWIKSQLERLDRKRYLNVVVFCHQAPFSSGPHGGPRVEPETVELRKRYMPLFNASHVRVVFSGHEHLFEHWVERYSDASGTHRMDLVVSGGGGAPIYAYSGEPDLSEYLKTNEGSKVKLEHLVRPSVERGSNPYHYVIVRVEGEKLDLQVFSVDWGTGFQPYRSNSTSLEDK